MHMDTQINDCRFRTETVKNEEWIRKGKQ